MYDGNIQIAISQLRQTRHFWVLNGGEGFVVGKRVVGDMETIIIDQTVRIWWHIMLSAGFDGITFRCFRDNDVNSLTIVATSREYTDFAFVTLTREELSSGLEDRKYDGIIIWDCLNDGLLKVHMANFQESRRVWPQWRAFQHSQCHSWLREYLKRKIYKTVMNFQQ